MIVSDPSQNENVQTEPIIFLFIFHNICSHFKETDLSLNSGCATEVSLWISLCFQIFIYITQKTMPIL